MKILVIDAGGLHVSTARKFGLEGHKVWYHVPWVSAYPKFETYAPGSNVPEIEKVLDWGIYADEADLIVFPDSGMGGVADYLRRKGHVVFGAGLGEETEFDRMKFVELQDKLGMKRPPSWEVRGFEECLTKLQELLGTSETNQLSTGKYFVKFNIWRGTLESFPVESLEQTKFLLDSVRPGLGTFADQIPMVIQEKIEGVETGGDGFYAGDHWVMPVQFGFENGANYVCKIVSDLGFQQADIEKWGEYLKSVDYRGAFSWECIYDGKDCYWIDATPRFGMPLGLMWANYIDDLGQLFFEIAKGTAEDSRLPLGEYLGCAEISSEEGINKYLKLSGGENVQWMRFMQDKEGDIYSVPGCSTLGIICGRGESLEAVEKDLEKNSEDVSAFFGSFDTEFIASTREKFIDPLKEMGIDFETEGKTEARITTTTRTTRAGRLLREWHVKL